jgi:hypothetical protein
MNREVHVRFCEGPKVKLLRPTHPYVAIAVGFAYVAVVLDAWSRRVIGYSDQPFDRRPADGRRPCWLRSSDESRHLGACIIPTVKR